MHTMLPAVFVEGIAFWSARLPGWSIARDVMRGELEAPQSMAPRPSPTLLAPTERRRAPDTVAIALEVAATACDAAGRAPKQLASVFASTHGDLAISDYMCSTLADAPTLVSPVKFHNSVHNAAAGYWSIGTGSLLAYTALSASRYTFSVGLLEAVTQVLCERAPVLYVAFDIAAKGPLASVAPSEGLLGTALVLAPDDEGAKGTRMSVVVDDCPGSTAPQSPAAALVAGNALAPCVPFFEALALNRRGVQLQLSERAGLAVSFG